MGYYEIKIKNKWVLVQSESMIELNSICEKNSDIKDWKMLGMMSRSEMLEAKKSKHISFYAK